MSLSMGRLLGAAFGDQCKQGCDRCRFLAGQPQCSQHVGFHAAALTCFLLDMTRGACRKKPLDGRPPDSKEIRARPVCGEPPPEPEPHKNKKDREHAAQGIAPTN